MASEDAMQRALQQLIAEDAVGQLRRREGLMAALGSENGALKLDWVEAVARLLADPDALEGVEAEARAIRARGIRHIIWAGMGGSVLTVRVLCDLGFGGGRDGDGKAITIHPLDSTDPAALNAIIRAIAGAKGLTLPSAPEQVNAAILRALLRDVMMVGVAMGMTSEEPITHLTWFADLLAEAGLPPAEHLLVMTLPGSYLDAFARERQAPTRPLQLDSGTGTGGRMSAPGTRVFLLPAALCLTSISAEPGQLRASLRAAWDAYDLDLAASRPAEHPFVRLAAALSAASNDGACRVLVSMPEGWGSFVSWLEQLMEESLGKGGKGIVVFDEQTLNTSAPGYRGDGLLRVRVATEAPERDGAPFVLIQPALASAEPRDRLAALVASFLGWQLAMALYGYLHRIPFAGQPAVENYKTRARALRGQPDPLAVAANWQPAVHDGMLTLLAPAGDAAPEPDAATSQPASVFGQALAMQSRGLPLGYLDVTVNGAAGSDLLDLLGERARAIGNTLLGVPVKLRQAPAAYHSTEQSEMDGPSNLVSLRFVARESEACLLGSYTNAFLHAQAVSTWQAMMEAGRPCFLLVIDGSFADAREPLAAFWSQVEAHLRNG
jgi:glucose-6-phosphate isomerase